MALPQATFNCWIYEEDVDNIFSVNVSETGNVAALKQSIKDSASDRFANTPARKLQVYSLPHPGDIRQVTRALRRWSPDDKDMLHGLMKISEVNSEHLIVVKEPSSGSRATKPSVIATDMTLHYWVLGESMDDYFSIQVSSMSTIEALKKAIKNEHPKEFREMGLKDLPVFKASFAFGEGGSLDGLLSARTISSLGKPLQNQRKLSSVFNPPPLDNQLHFIVAPEGPVAFQCWFRGADPASFFEVPISINARVGGLKNAIKAVCKELGDLSANLLKLYEILAADEPELREILGAMGSGRLLQENESLRKIFNNVPFSRIPLVVVEPVYNKISKPPSRLIGSLNDDPIARERAAFLTSSATKDRPSSTGTPSSFRARQLDPHRHKSIPCGRPREYEETIPTILLHPVFGQFVHDCQSASVTAEDERFAEELATAMSALYVNESDRVRAIDKAFSSHNIHLTIPQTKTSGYAMDAYINLKDHHYVIAEFKNETGNTSAEPYFQAIAYYEKATKGLAVEFRRSPLPCLLLAIYGPHIEFAGAAWNLRPTVQLLSTPIAFHFHTTDMHNQRAVARHMVAFRNAAGTLKKYYETLQATPLANFAPVSQMFPHPRSYRPYHNGTQVTFQYSEQLNKDKLVFSGVEDESNDCICIKFVQTYSPNAHSLLADQKCAPALRGCQEIPGGWTMVVMDLLPFQTLVEAGEAAKKPLPSSVFAGIYWTLNTLHKAGFVHGDIRDTNIMVSTDKKQVMLIDFDWAGVNGQARYPMNVNRGPGLWRPHGAVDKALITAKHDIEMLKSIIQRYGTKYDMDIVQQT